MPKYRLQDYKQNQKKKGGKVISAEILPPKKRPDLIMEEATMITDGTEAELVGTIEMALNGIGSCLSKGEAVNYNKLAEQLQSQISKYYEQAGWKSPTECESCADAFISTQEEATNKVRAQVKQEVISSAERIFASPPDHSVKAWREWQALKKKLEE